MKNRSIVVKLLALASAGFSFIVIRNLLNKPHLPLTESIAEKTASPKILLETPATTTIPTPPQEIKEDNLTQISGIGPKYQQILKTAGIKTFQQLSSQTNTDLETILSAANVRIMNCSTWAEQANALIQS